MPFAEVLSWVLGVKDHAKMAQENPRKHGKVRPAAAGTKSLGWKKTEIHWSFDFILCGRMEEQTLAVPGPTLKRLVFEFGGISPRKCTLQIKKPLRFPPPEFLGDLFLIHSHKVPGSQSGDLLVLRVHGTTPGASHVMSDLEPEPRAAAKLRSELLVVWAPASNRFQHGTVTARPF